jgi:hypothetical protein
MATAGTVEKAQFDLEKELEAMMANDKVEDAGDDKVEGKKEDEGTEVKIDKVDGEKAEDKGFKVYFYRGSARMGPVRVAGDTSTLAIQQLLDDPAKATKLRVAKATKPVDCNLAIKHDKEFTVVEGVLDADVDYYLIKKGKAEATKKAKAEAVVEDKAWKEARSALPKTTEPPKKRGRPVDDNKGELLQKILAGGEIATEEEYICARKLLASQNAMMARALKAKTVKEDHTRYTTNVVAVERAVNLAAPQFDAKYGARDEENNKTMRTIVTGVVKLTEAARQGNSENRDKDAEIARLKARLAVLEGRFGSWIAPLVT